MELQSLVKKVGAMRLNGLIANFGLVWSNLGWFWACFIMILGCFLTSIWQHQWSVRKGLNQSIRRTKEQKTRLQCLAWAIRNFAWSQKFRLTSRAKFLTRSEISLDTGFKNFGTGAESESEKVTPATFAANHTCFTSPFAVSLLIAGHGCHFWGICP